MTTLRSVPTWRAPTRTTGWAAGGPTTVTAHYFGVDVKLGSVEDLFKVWRNVQNNDMDAKGYSDIMYNLGLSPFSDDVYLLRGLNNRNAANGSTFSNSASISVLVPLGPEGALLTQRPTAGRNIRDGAIAADQIIADQFRINPPWMPHSFWRPTGCPGAWMLAQLEEIELASERPVPPPIVPFLPDPDYSRRPWLQVGSTDATAAHQAGIVYNGDGYVSHLQRVLNGAAGQNIAVDGIFGGGDGNAWENTTESAVINLQRYFGAFVDGIVWTETWGLIHWISTMTGVT